MFLAKIIIPSQAYPAARTNKYIPFGNPQDFQPQNAETAKPKAFATVPGSNSKIENVMAKIRGNLYQYCPFKDSINHVYPKVMSLEQIYIFISRSLY